MQTKTFAIGAAIVVVLIIGAIVGYSFMNNGSATQAGGDLPTDQVQAQEVTVGTGAEATPGKEVSVLYVGRFEDGTVFDSSEAHGNEPLVFVLGGPNMIPGFQIGVNGMKEGGERLIAIPPALAYGDRDVTDQAGKVIIPANSTLVFSVRLVKVADPAPAASATTDQ